MSGVDALAKVLNAASKPPGASPLGGYVRAYQQAERVLADPAPLLAALAEAGVLTEQPSGPDWPTRERRYVTAWQEAP